MTSRVSQRAVGIVVASAILLLVLLIVLLWAGVGAGLFRSGAPPPTQLRAPGGGGPPVAAAEADKGQQGGGGGSSKARKLSIADHADRHQVEYVKPLKMSPAPLHEEDILYGGDQWVVPTTEPPAPGRSSDGTPGQQPPIRHHSGHFRRKMAQLWDPHPQYEFVAFGRKFRLMLDHDTDEFVLPDVQVIHMWHNSSSRERLGLRPDGCFYRGKVKGDPQSSVSVSLCHGMTGLIRTAHGSFFIEPAEEWRNHTGPLLHAVYRTLAAGTRRAGDDDAGAGAGDTAHRCGLADCENDVPQVHDDAVPQQSSRRRRRRRSVRAQKYTVELMVVADKTMVAVHGSGLKIYILYLMKMVQDIFKDVSIGNPISIAVVNMVVLKDIDLVHPDKNSEGTSATEMLDNFCKWQANKAHFKHGVMHDTALLLTRYKICSNPQLQKCDTLGLAQLSSMCNLSSSCALVQDNGLNAAFTIAHELGHVLDMTHDEDSKCMAINGGPNIHNIMSRMLGRHTDLWSWSNCSRHFLTAFLESDQARCLLDRPFKDIMVESGPVDRLPGENFTQDKQCKLVFGDDSIICSYMPMCDQLWCTDNMSEGCRSKQMPWADGTPCKDGMWCQKGKCIPVNRTALRPIDGNWGPWSSFGPCSRTCGGGIKQSVRYCNSPAPANGGDYCVGKATRHRSCNIAECPEGSVSFREMQCSSFDNNTFGIVGLQSGVRWLPKYGLKNRCQLNCRMAHSDQYYPLVEKVIDGTPCGPDTFEMCVNGKCTPAGCNHVLYSKAKLDICGKCKGDNSTCKLISGSYNRTNYGYNFVVRIPAGAYGLDIRQGSTNVKDDHFLVLKDSETLQHVLNGGYMISTSRKLFMYHNVTLEYSRSNSGMERVNSSKPLKRDLIVEILSAGELKYPPNLTYQYTVSRDMVTEYTWIEGSEWSSCDRVCHGEKHIVPVCADIETHEQVGYENCKGVVLPQTRAEPCNSHCTLKWQIWSRSECSAHCGRGERTLNVQCVQEMTDTRQIYPMDNSSCLHLLAFRPPDREPCEGICDVVQWKYGKWGPCSRTCGGGVKKRTAECVDELGRQVDDSQCVASERITEGVCGDQNCPQWSIGDWFPCSATCGQGQRERPYWCQVDNHVVSANYCLDPVPMHKEPCELRPCAAWRLGPWGECSAPCGIGVMSRAVLCQDPNGSIEDDAACSAEPRPQHADQCKIRDCPSDNHPSLMPATSTVTSVSTDGRAGERDDSRHKLRHHNSLYPTANTVDAADNLIPHGIDDIQSNNIPVQTGDDDILPVRRSGRPRVTWRTSDWVQCSVTCGEGVKHRSVFCYDELLEARTDHFHCMRLVEPHRSEACIRPRCVTWRADEWQPCPVTCGEGKTFRKVTCVDVLTGIPSADGKACRDAGFAEPTSERSCGNYECPPTTTTTTTDAGIRDRPQGTANNDTPQAVWTFASDWGPCSKTCGGGVRTRVVKCKVADCSAFKRPVDTVQCSPEPCPIWNVGAWAPCEKTCGFGYQHRLVRCESHRGESLPDSTCPRAEQPEHYRLCDPALPPCPASGSKHYRWKFSRWSQCSQTCGKGQQQRSVSCHRVLDGWLDPNPVLHGCDPATKPAHVQTCSVTDCHASFFWSAGEWQPCMHFRGRCKQKRDVYCISTVNRKVPKRNCARNSKPRHRRKCPQKKCGFSSCADVQQRLRSNQNGEYVLNIRGRNVSVYCHDMDTNVPREYLSLPEGDSINYAEIYDRRLLNPDTCPNNGDRMDKCDCVVDANGNAGRTVYSRVQLNVTSLRINTQDYTFAQQVWGRHVAYAEAGDCYSRVTCPQGRFNINLKGTGLSVSDATHWQAQGSSPALAISKSADNQVIDGRCGGYCGTCSPHVHVGLKLDVLPP